MLSSLETDTKKTKILLTFVWIWPTHLAAATRRPSWAAIQGDNAAGDSGQSREAGEQRLLPCSEHPA